MSVAPVEILIAEDNPEHAQLALHAFKRHRLTNPVHVVGDGQTALDFLFCQGEYKNRERATGGELVLLDLRLPDINGLEVLGRIKANADTKSTRVVMLTASTEGEHIRESFRMGAEAYIVKPVTFTAFLEAVRDSGHALTMVGKES